jgi:hypothetical protein
VTGGEPIGTRRRVVDGHPAQQPGQASQFDEFIPAIRAARQVSIDGVAIGWPDRAKDVDPKSEANLAAFPGSSHAAGPECAGRAARALGRNGCLRRSRRVG